MVGLRQVFTEVPDAGAWGRFERYSKRVRRLSYNAAGATHVLNRGVFDDVGRTRTSLKILPSMNTLEWNGPLRHCVMFMHNNVKQFAIHLPESLSTVLPGHFFQDIVSRMPGITNIDIRTDIPMHNIEAEAIGLFRGLQKLEKITLPRFHLTTKIAECVSRLENLGALEFQYLEAQGCGDSDDTAVFRPALTEGAFPSLWDLSITSSFADATSFIDMPFAPTNLTMLYIDSQLLETPEDVHRALATIADNCQLLKSLALISLVDPNRISEGQPPKDECINVNTLQPLLRCPNLTSLELVHQYPLDLQQEDIEKIAAKWPSLETLLLNNEPAYLQQSSLTLKALLPFARHCPNLRHLGLFIHASTADLPTSYHPDPSSTYQYPPFKKLRRLSMGVSVIANDGPVVLFLSQICPLQCHIDSGVTWDESITVTETMAVTIQTRCELWEKVVELLPLLTKLRMEERDRARVLQSEVEDLRMRTGVLMDKAAIPGAGDACVIV